MQQLTSNTQAHSTPIIPGDTNIPQPTNLKCRRRSHETAINEQEFSTKLIYPLVQNVEIRHMPKAIYYFNIPPRLDDVCILILEPPAAFWRVGHFDRHNPTLIKCCLLPLVSFAHQGKAIETFPQTISRLINDVKWNRRKGIVHYS